MLLSRLSPHTRHLLADGRCSLLVAGAAENANPQTTPRVTLIGMAEPDPDPAAKARFLTIHPYAALYADFTDFSIFRLHPTSAQLVGGFGRAHRLKRDDMLTDTIAEAALQQAADTIIAHCNTHHAEALATIAGSAPPWRMVTIDTDGFDLAQANDVRRFAWPSPVSDAEGARNALQHLAQAARMRAAQPTGGAA